MLSAPTDMGLDAVAISGDGARAAFKAYPENTGQLLLWDREPDQVLAAYPLGDGTRGAVSADGRYVAFSSRSDEIALPPPHDQGGVFVVDVESGGAWQVSVGPTGEAGSDYSAMPDLSDDGRFTVFASVAPNLVANLSRDGELVLFATDGDGLAADDDNGRMDVFVYDAARDAFELVSRARDGALLGEESTAVALSGDGRVAAFGTRADELTDGEVHVTCFAVR